MIKDYLTIPLQEIKRRKMHSLLTLLGIIIGIAAVVSLILLGQGLQNAIMNQFDALGNDKLFITAKGSSLTPGLTSDAVTITQDDVDAIRSTSGVKKVAAMIYATTRIEFNDNVRYFSIAGMPTDPLERELLGEAQSFKVLKGRSLEDGDMFKAVLGFEYTKPGLFEKEIELGNKILIQDTEFKVVGFWEKIGSPPDDQSITIPLGAYSDIFGTDDEVGFIVAQVQAGEDPTVVGERIERDLRKHRDLDEGKEDFTVETPENLLGTFTTILDIVQAVLVGIAAISLIVGGVGIMNTMYTAVLQRTKEIGVMKAIGAQRKHILALFLVESGLYGIVGGLIGITIGVSFAKIIEQIFIAFVGPALLSVEIDFVFLLGTLLFSFIVGAVSGIAPAKKAASLNPVDALRYE